MRAAAASASYAAGKDVQWEANVASVQANPALWIDHFGDAAVVDLVRLFFDTPLDVLAGSTPLEAISCRVAFSGISCAEPSRPAHPDPLTSGFRAITSPATLARGRLDLLPWQWGAARMRGSFGLR